MCVVCCPCTPPLSCVALPFFVRFYVSFPHLSLISSPLVYLLPFLHAPLLLACQCLVHFPSPSLPSSPFPFPFPPLPSSAYPTLISLSSHLLSFICCVSLPVVFVYCRLDSRSFLSAPYASLSPITRHNAVISLGVQRVPRTLKYAVNFLNKGGAVYLYMPGSL